ncbi:MAG: hypothetical protein AABY10_05960 [Nanoarchaeota archaeon]
MNWIIVAGIVVVLYVLFMFKMNNFRTKVAFIFIFLGVCFVLMTAYYVLSDNKPDLSNIDGWTQSGKVYFSWLTNAFSSAFKVTGDAIKEIGGNVAKNSTNITRK